jgi:chemotaxis response regulator CheB
VSQHVAIALLYQVPALNSHLKDALTELGARVVYDSTAEAFDRGALSKSGAEVVVVNLDPEVGDEFEHLDDLLSDEHLRVVFNDAEVSSRLEGWEQARWARHLAAKILGVEDTNPPRPAGAEAIPVRVKAAAPEYIGAPETPDAFHIGGSELAAALAADTGESLRRTRAALQTSDEPVAAQLVPPETMLQPSVSASRHEAPTVELPREALGARPAPPASEAPTRELPIPAATAAFKTPAELAMELEEFNIDTGAESTAPVPSRAPTPDFADFGDFEDLAVEPASASAAAAAPAADDLDANLREFGLLGSTAAPAAAPAAEEPAPAGEDEFAFATGLQFEPLDDDLGGSEGEALKPRQPAEPVGGLDDFLLSLDADDKPVQPPAKAAPTPAPKPAAPAPAAAKAPPAARPAEAPAPRAAPPSVAAAPPPAAAAAAATPEPRSSINKGPARELSSFDLSALSLEPIDGEGEAKAAPVTGRATYRIDEPKPAEEPRAPAPAPTPAEARAPAADDLHLDPLDFDFDTKTEIEAPQLDRGAGELGEDLDLVAELEAAIGPEASAAAPVAKAEGPVQRVWVLGASIGGPEAVREFLGALPKDVPAVFLLAQHMGADFLDLMTQQLARATPLTVRTVTNGDRVAYGEVVIVPLAERLLVDASGEVRLATLDEMSPYSPSIDQVMRDVADRFGADAGAIIFSGMAHDAIDGAVYMAGRGGRIWAQDPATCVISSMVDGARDAGVVSVVAAPAELARRFMLEVFKSG